jgi:hypothetical protein
MGGMIHKIGSLLDNRKWLAIFSIHKPEED